MIKNKRVLALIPARGGSKRLPRKNILPLAGIPLIAWTIDAALKSKYVDRVVVSTDDEEIMCVSKQFGAAVPFVRPVELASDTATSTDVVLHALKFFKNEFDVVVLLQPSSPLREEGDIDRAIEQFVCQDANGIVSVSECEHTPLWANTLPADGSMSSFITKDALKRSQDLETFYRLNGAIYCYKTDYFMANKGGSYADGVYAYIMGKEKSVDIDDITDFKFAEFLIGLRG